MPANRSFLEAIVKMKCPRCREGNLFLYPTAFNFKNIHKMPEHCAKCGQEFEPEPGFYTGAMYVNYGFAVMITALSYLILEIILDVREFVFWISYLTIMISLWPFLFRYSRVLYLYLFVSYDQEAMVRHSKENPKT